MFVVRINFTDNSGINSDYSLKRITMRVFVHNHQIRFKSKNDLFC